MPRPTKGKTSPLVPTDTRIACIAARRLGTRSGLASQSRAIDDPDLFRSTNARLQLSDRSQGRLSRANPPPASGRCVPLNLRKKCRSRNVDAHDETLSHMRQKFGSTESGARETP